MHPGRPGIIVWAKWQSSTAFGDGGGAIVKGNRRPGNGPVIVRESLLDLKPQCLPGLLPLTLVFLNGRGRWGER